MVLAMSFGSVGYGYSASIIGTTLGIVSTAHHAVYPTLTSRIAQPSFIKYFGLDTRSNATSLISTMNVGSLKLCIHREPVLIRYRVSIKLGGSWVRSWSAPWQTDGVEKLQLRWLVTLARCWAMLTGRQSALITLLSGALLAGSVNNAMFIVFRFTSGAG